MGEQNESIGVLKKRVEIVRSALCGINYWLSDPIPFIYPVIDYLKLLCPGQTSLRFVLLADKSIPIFEVRELPTTAINVLDQTLVIPNPEEGGAPQYGISIQCSASCLANSDCSCGLFSDLFAAKEIPNIVFDRFLQKLNESLDHYAESPSVSNVFPEGELPGLQRPCQNTLESLLLPVRTEVSSIYASAQAEERSEAIPNIFSHIFIGAENRSAHASHLILSEQQEQSLREECARAGLNYANTFTQVTGFFSETISSAYSALKDGVISKVPIPSMVPDPLLNILGVSCGEVPDQILSMPVHVEGVPWMVVSRFSRSTDESAWLDNFYCYHDFLNRLGVHIRGGVKQCFLAAAERVLVDALEAGGRGAVVIQKINKGWGRLSRYYPYARLRLEMILRSDMKEGEQVLLLEENDHVAVVHLEKNPFFDQEFLYDPIDSGAVIKVCQSVVADYNQAVRRGETNSELSIAHDIDTPISVLQEEYDCLSESGKLAVDYLEIWRRFAKRDFEGELPRSVARLFEDNDHFFKGVYGLGHYRALRRNMAPRDPSTGKEIPTEILLEHISQWLDVEINLPPEIVEAGAASWASFAKTWLLFFAIGAAHHTIAYSFKKYKKIQSWNDGKIRKSLFRIDYRKSEKELILRVIDRGNLAAGPSSMFHSSLMETVAERRKIERTSNSFSSLPSFEGGEEPSVYPQTAKLIEVEGEKSALWAAEIHVKMR